MPDDPSKKSAQARFMYLYGGVAPLVTSLITPCALYLGLRKNPDIAALQRSKEFFQEIGRQSISAAIGLIFYFTGGELTRLWQRGKTPEQRQDANAQLQKFVTGLIVSFIGYAFVRPIVHARYIDKFSGKEPVALIRPVENFLAALEKLPGGGKPALFVGGIGLLGGLAALCQAIVKRTKPIAPTPIPIVQQPALPRASFQPSPVARPHATLPVARSAQPFTAHPVVPAARVPQTFNPALARPLQTF